MKRETYNDHDVFEIDIDGRQSDPIPPRTPKQQEEFDRRRQAYIKAGLVIDSAAKKPAPKPEAE